MRKKFSTPGATVFLTCALLCLVQSAGAQTRNYRGAIGNSHFQMHLTFAGNDVSGTYAYDTVGEDLRLSSRLDQGRMELAEFAPKGKQKTGKFVCKRFDDPLDQECSWSRPDGSRESLVVFEEQNLGTTSG